MNDTAELEFPTIDPAPPATQTAVAVAASQALDLEKMDLAAIVRSGFQPSRDKAAEATKTLTGVVHDLSTQAKIDAAISLRQRLIKGPAADVRKLTKGIKSKLTAASTVAGEQETQALAAFTAAEALITPQIDAAEAKLEAERQAKAAAEAARKDKHEENLQRLTGAAQRARDTGADSTKIAEGIAALEGLPISEAWEEFRERAEAARVAAIEALRTLHAEVLGREQQAAENERLRLLAEQQAAELERLRKAEAARKEAEAAQARAAATPAAIAGATLVDTGAGMAENPAQQREAAQVQRSEMAVSLSAGQHSQESAGSTPAGRQDDSPMAAERRGGHAEDSEDLPGVAPGPLHHPTGPAVEACRPATAKETTHAGAQGQAAAADEAKGAGDDAKHAGDLQGPAVNEALLAECLALVRYARTAFETRFPSHPKPSEVWWAGLRERIERIERAEGSAA